MDVMEAALIGLSVFGIVLAVAFVWVLFKFRKNKA